MSQSTRSAIGLRRPARDQAISSGAADTTASRRRIDDDSNWLDAETSSDEETTSDEDGGDAHGHHGKHTATQSARTPTSTAVPSITSHSSTATLASLDPAPDLNADRGRAGGRRKPLISYVTNDWQNKDFDEKKHPYYTAQKSYQPPRRRRSPSPNCFDEMCEAGSFLDCLDVVWSRVTVRVVVGWVAVIFLIWSMKWWFGTAAKKYAHSGALRSSVQLKLKGATPRGPKGRARTWFGGQHVSDFAGVVQVAGIKDEDWAWADGKRMLVVGDVHGCPEPLERLLKETKFSNGRDHLIFTGDLVAKGPDTAAVLDIARSYNASSVRGNHDDKLLLLHRDLNGPLKAIQTQSSIPITGTEVHRKESDLAASLSKEQIDYLRSFPLILDLGELPGLAPQAFVAHAGLVPGVSLEKQEPSAVMNMRSIDIRSHTPLRVHCPETLRRIIADPASEYKDLPPPWDNKKSKVKVFDLDEKYVLPWTRLWEEWQTSVESSDRSLLLYGHDSPVGLVDGPWAVGLDTGCVKGGKLTALILEMKKGKVTRKIQSVACEDARASKKNGNDKADSS